MKESSDSEPHHGAGECSLEPRRGVGEAEREGGGCKKSAPRSIVFSSRFARARVSLSCESALPCSGRRCVCAHIYLMLLSHVSRRSASCAGVICVGENAGLFSGVCYLCLWRALGQSAQVEQGTLILYSSQESVMLSDCCCIRRTLGYCTKKYLAPPVLIADWPRALQQHKQHPSTSLSLRLANPTAWLGIGTLFHY